MTPLERRQRLQAILDRQNEAIREYQRIRDAVPTTKAGIDAAWQGMLEILDAQCRAADAALLADAQTRQLLNDESED